MYLKYSLWGSSSGVCVVKDVKIITHGPVTWAEWLVLSQVGSPQSMGPFCVAFTRCPPMFGCFDCTNMYNRLHPPAWYWGMAEMQRTITLLIFTFLTSEFWHWQKNTHAIKEGKLIDGIISSFRHKMLLNMQWLSDMRPVCSVLTK